MATQLAGGMAIRPSGSSTHFLEQHTPPLSGGLGEVLEHEEEGQGRQHKTDE